MSSIAGHVTEETRESAATSLDGTGKITHSDGIPIVLDAASPFNGQRPSVLQLPAIFYQKFISDESKRRKPNPIRGLFPLERRPGVISLLAGKPNPVTFPITNLQVTVRAPSWGTSSTPEETTLDISKESLAAGLQYGSTAGLEPLVSWVEGLQEYSHGRKQGEGWRVSMGSGSQDLLYKAFHALINPGDSLLVESPVYSGVLPIVDELRGEIVPVETDSEGIKSSFLRSVLETWPSSKPLPKFLYTVPYGCNPSGTTASTERRREVLELSRKYDFLILEDDPYYYLYYGKAARPPSFFTLELEQPDVGRVLRFDSLSKILSAGIRIAFASGPAPLLDAINLHTASANLQVSSLTQVITLSVMQSWGYDGFKTHTEAVAEFYRQKRDAFEKAMHHHLSDIAEWSTPEAGMFFWFKLLLNDPSKPASVVDEDSEELISTRALENGVLALPGTSFLATGGKTAYVRASFSLLEQDAIEEALRRLREVIVKAREGL
ncbi:PLP-dependent transferase [Phellopilus nigrolimitatus]|nr:PLP-dependent transferase [Phellopilus nigrolimitatus]